MQQVLDNVGELPTSAGAKDIDLLFLRGIMESPIVRSLAKVAHTHSSGQAAVSRQTSQLQATPRFAPSSALSVLAEVLKCSKALTNTVLRATNLMHRNSEKIVQLCMSVRFY